MAAAIYATFPEFPDRVVGRVQVFDNRSVEVWTDGGDHWNVYEPTRQQAAALVRQWRQFGLRVEREAV